MDHSGGRSVNLSTHVNLGKHCALPAGPASDAPARTLPQDRPRPGARSTLGLCDNCRSRPASTALCTDPSPRARAQSAAQAAGRRRGRLNWIT